jgi:hypothetical protein
MPRRSEPPQGQPMKRVTELSRAELEAMFAARKRRP